MDRIDTYRNGTLVKQTLIDYDKQRVEIYEADEKSNLSLSESRVLTEDEIQAVSVSEAEKSSTDRLRAALETNTRYISLEKPTAAQVAAQTKALTRQVSALLKLQLREYSEV